MYRLLVLLALFTIGLAAQQKKIVTVMGDPATIADWQSVTIKVKIVSLDGQGALMREIVDADAIIGDITPEIVRAGKNLKWAQVMSAGVERNLHLSGGNDLRDSNIVLTNNQIVQGPE